MSSSTSHSCLSMPPPLKSPLRFAVSRFEALFPPNITSFIVRSFRYYHPRASVMLPSPPSPDLRCARSGHELVRLRAPRGHAVGGAPLERVRSRDPPPAAECRRTRRRARACSRSGCPPVPKRFIVSSSLFTWKEAVELTAQAKPEQKGCLPVVTGKRLRLRRSRHSTRVLKGYVKWQDTVLDTIDDMLRVEELAAAAQ